MELQFVAHGSENSSELVASQESVKDEEQEEEEVCQHVTKRTKTPEPPPRSQVIVHCKVRGHIYTWSRLWVILHRGW